jgi:hypothetical protein
MNGDSRETGKLTPDGKPDPSVFSTKYNKEGIRLGTAIGLMVRREKRSKQPDIYFRHFWGANKREDLLESLNVKDFGTDYKIAISDVRNRYSFCPSNVDIHYLEWPKLTELCAVPPSNGLMEKRGGALIDMDKECLEKRMKLYYDASIDWEVIKALKTGLSKDAARFNAKEARKKVIMTENYNINYLQRYILRPFESLWCYYSSVRPLWNEPRPSLWAQCWEGNSFLLSRPTGVAQPEGIPIYYTNLLGDNDFQRGHSYYFPIRLRTKNNQNNILSKQTESLFNTEEFTNNSPKANLSEKSRQYLTQLGITNIDTDVKTAELIWMHALAIGYSPLYLTENADGIRQDFPRIPLPNTQELLLTSAALGQQIASLLDTENSVTGVTTKLRSELKVIAVISKLGGGQLNPDNGDLKVTANWGNAGKNGVTMPGKGKIIEREYTPEELTAIEQGASELGMTLEEVKTLLGQTTCDIYLNDIAYWKNIPLRVWKYTIGGYQVIKKWLSYREEKLLERPLKTEEVKEVCNMARRIAAIVLLESQLDRNYLAVKALSYKWEKSK